MLQHKHNRVLIYLHIYVFCPDQASDVSRNPARRKITIEIICDDFGDFWTVQKLQTQFRS